MIILVEERELFGYLVKFKKSEFISLIFALLREIKRLIRTQKKVAISRFCHFSVRAGLGDKFKRLGISRGNFLCPPFFGLKIVISAENLARMFAFDLKGVY